VTFDSLYRCWHSPQSEVYLIYITFRKLTPAPSSCVLLHGQIPYSEGFWRWCITHRITGFFGLFHRPVF
jgi:hypothetical protein